MENLLLDPIVRRVFLQEVRKHEAQDRIIQGDFGDNEETQALFRGCFFGCSWNSLRRAKPNAGIEKPWSRELISRAMGLPSELGLLAEAIFEHLPYPSAPPFVRMAAEAVARAAARKADLSRVWAQIALAALADGRVGAMYATDNLPVRTLVEQAARLYWREIDGDMPSQGEWSAAEHALKEASEDGIADWDEVACAWHAVGVRSDRAHHVGMMTSSMHDPNCYLWLRDKLLAFIEEA